MSSLKAEVADLGRSGCQGNAKDYESWLRFLGKVDHPNEQQVEAALEELVADGDFSRHPEYAKEYMAASLPDFPSSVSYTVSGQLHDSPIQMVRSRLESFLRFHKVDDANIIDLTIGTTEAMENAVKYSDHGDISLSYQIANGSFKIEVVNNIAEASPEDDIESGKYSSSVTLMRGMMVMVKLFDDMDIDISEEKHCAVFSAVKRL